MIVQNFRKKPIMVQAVQLTNDNVLEVFRWCNANEWNTDPAELKIKTLEGVMTVREGDYIICGVNGEFYPCKPDIFAKTYDVIQTRTRMSEAEVAVIEAAKVMAYAISEIEKHSYDEYKAASNNLVAAVATLRELEGEAMRDKWIKGIEAEKALAAKVAADTQRWIEYGNMIEDTAKIIYDAMLKHAPDHQQYPWVEGGNSLAQNIARSVAQKLNLLTPTHITVIDAAKAKVQSLSQFNQYNDESTAILFDARLIEAVDALE